jgi:TonB family protein
MKRRFLKTLFLLAFFIDVKAQTQKQEEESYYEAEANIGLSEEQSAMFKWLANNIKYAEETRKKRIEGKVIVRFVIEKDGCVNNVTILRGANEQLNQEVLRIIYSMPRWDVGIHQGKGKSSYFTIPIVFKLDEEK